MRTLIHSTRLFFAALMVAGLLAVGGIGSANAASGATITFHVFNCPTGGENLFDSCHRWNSNAIDGARFRVAGVTRATDDGFAQWRPGAGFHLIKALDFSSASYVVCTNQVTGAVLFDGRTTTNWLKITTTAGQETVCDWYYLDEF
jgi:hypothetical protein